jgi:predicted GIY-YIG superfamily endonuclease
MSTVYVLSLENNKYYVGKTNDLKSRLHSHFSGCGSAWTKKYKPIKLITQYDNCEQFDEEKYTLIYMKKYGVENVRGGIHTQIVLDKSSLDNIMKAMANENNVCFHCNLEGHFINECPTKNNNIIIHKKYCIYCTFENDINASQCVMCMNNFDNFFGIIEKSMNDVANCVSSFFSNIIKI